VAGAAANALPDPVPEAVKEERYARFMLHQQAISSARLQARVGRAVDVLVDEAGPDGAVGRCSADAPEIDGRVFLDGVSNLQPGDLVRAVVTRSDAYDLWAEPLAR
jgi:ribosomal protein S12 methylthiotransferase